MPNLHACVRASCCFLRRATANRSRLRAAPLTSMHRHAVRQVHTTAEGAQHDDPNLEASMSAFEALCETLYQAETHSRGITPFHTDDALHLTSSVVTGPDAALADPIDEASLDDMMDLLMDPSVGATDAAVTTVSGTTPPQEMALRVAADRGPIAALMALLTVDGREQAPSHAAASELLTTGLDVKAVLAGRPLTDVHLSHRSLRQCDLSFMPFERVTCESCDFRRSLLYRAQLSQVVFRHCRFDGAVLRQVVCHNDVLFEDCSFCFADVGLHRQLRTRGGPADPSRRSSSRRSSAVRFVRCDFDLCTFDGSEGLNDPGIFHNCRNTRTAYHFPLRVQSEESR